MTYDFSGYATRANVLCTDGRVILPNAFKHHDGERVPLVWQHGHKDPTNILGHAILEARDDGVYAYCAFNKSKSATSAKEAVQHGDVDSLSIFANRLRQNGSNVEHGMIREVSLVLTGANPGAFIDNISFSHDDGWSDEDAIIYSGESLYIKHEDSEKPKEEKQMAEKTIQDVLDSMSEEQLNVLYYIVGKAVNDAEAEHGDLYYDDEEEYMKHNIFENGYEAEDVLSHAEIQEIFDDAKQYGSLRESVLAHSATYGIENIDILFPDAKTMPGDPDFIKRDTEWVSSVMMGTKKNPFTRLKSINVDITAEEARAKGYVKGKRKKEEVIKALKRVTGPTTIYKKQKLDRDDILDISDFDVVRFLKAEMRLMLNEEIARAILIGDGRDISSEEKINEECIRPIYKEDEIYVHRVELENVTKTEEIIESIIRSRKEYKGKGKPTMFTTSDFLTDMLLLKDKMGRRLYNTQKELEDILHVDKIVEVPPMEKMSRTDEDSSTKLDLVAIMVNLNDYAVGTDKGGDVSMFDDFDIDFNQYKYLMETRMSGALLHPKSAIIIEKKQA